MLLVPGNLLCISLGLHCKPVPFLRHLMKPVDMTGTLLHNGRTQSTDAALISGLPGGVPGMHADDTLRRDEQSTIQRVVQDVQRELEAEARASHADKVMREQDLVIQKRWLSSLEWHACGEAIHAHKHQPLEAIRTGVEEGVNEIQDLRGQVGHLIDLVTEPAGAAEKTLIDRPGFELKGQRLEEYKCLQAAAKENAKKLKSKFGYIRDSFQNASKKKVTADGDQVWLQKAIAAKRKKQSNTTQWAKAVKQARQELQVSTAIVRKGAPVHARALQIQRLQRSSQSPLQAAPKQKLSSQQSICTRFNRALRLTADLIIGQRIHNGRNGYFCAEGVDNNKLARNLTTARKHIDEGLACATQLQEVLSSIPATITKAARREEQKRKHSRKADDAKAGFASKVGRQVKARKGT